MTYSDLVAGRGALMKIAKVRVNWIALDFVSTFSSSTSLSSLSVHHQRWNAALARINDVAPSTASSAFHTSDIWVRMTVQQGFISGVLSSLALCFAVIFVSIVAWTDWNVRLASVILVTCTSVFVVLLGLLVHAGYEVGATECICICLIVPLTTSQLLQFGYAYTQSAFYTRFGRARHALLEWGGLQLTAAFTTMLSTFVLLWSEVVILQTVGNVVCSFSVIGVMGAWTLLIPLLMVYGSIRPGGEKHKHKQTNKGKEKARDKQNRLQSGAASEQSEGQNMNENETANQAEAVASSSGSDTSSFPTSSSASVPPSLPPRRSHPHPHPHPTLPTRRRRRSVSRSRQVDETEEEVDLPDHECHLAPTKEEDQYAHPYSRRRDGGGDEVEEFEYPSDSASSSSASSSSDSEGGSRNRAPSSGSIPLSYFRPSVRGDLQSDDLTLSASGFIGAGIQNGDGSGREKGKGTWRQAYTQTQRQRQRQSRSRKTNNKQNATASHHFRHELFRPHYYYY